MVYKGFCAVHRTVYCCVAKGVGSISCPVLLRFFSLVNPTVLTVSIRYISLLFLCNQEGMVVAIGRLHH